MLPYAMVSLGHSDFKYWDKAFESNELILVEKAEQ